MRRNDLKGREGDRMNAVLAAAGDNFSYAGSGVYCFADPCSRRLGAPL
jgi:hypothetical protein